MPCTHRLSSDNLNATGNQHFSPMTPRHMHAFFFALPLFNRKPLLTLPLHSFTYLNPSSSTGIIPRQYDTWSQGKWKDKLSQWIASNNLWDKIMWLCMQLYIYLNQPFLLYWQWNGPTVKQHYFSFMCLSFLWFSNWPRQVSIIAQLVDGFSCRSHCDQVYSVWFSTTLSDENLQPVLKQRWMGWSLMLQAQ